MKEKISNWMAKPVTYGAVVKYTAFCMALGVAEIVALVYGPAVVDKVKDLKGDKIVMDNGVDDIIQIED